ncbi:helix-turn-helix domain-containing protein [Sphingomonas sp. Marseille-Q8236]
MAEVGYSIGFSDPAYFTRFFTRHTSVSPRAYRQMGTN